MNVLVFGASGATGRHVVSQGLERGLNMTAFVRNPSKLAITHPKLTVVQGEVGDAAAVSNAVKGHDAVVSTLGVGAPLRHDPVVIDGIRFIVKSMTDWNVPRLVYMSFVGVADSRADAGFMVRYVARWPLRNEIRDHEIKEDLVIASALNWTIVRAPTLTNGPRTGTYRVGPQVAATSFLPMMSRADVAECILRELGDDAHTRTVLRVQPQ